MSHDELKMVQSAHFTTKYMKVINVLSYKEGEQVFEQKADRINDTDQKDQVDIVGSAMNRF